MKKQGRNGVVRQARSSETHQRSYHQSSSYQYCSEAHAGACLVKDAAVIMRAEKASQASTSCFFRPGGCAAYPIKRVERHEPPPEGMEEWRRTKGTRLLSWIERIEDSKLREKERRTWAATHQRSLKVVHLAFERFIGLALRGRCFLPLRLHPFLLGNRLFFQFHLLTSCPFVQLQRGVMKFETAT